MSGCYTCILGAYAPLTMEGNIVVDEVLASCYASVQHDFGQIMMIPLRWFPSMTAWIFGEENGASNFVEMTYHFGRWTLTYPQ